VAPGLSSTPAQIFSYYDYLKSITGAPAWVCSCYDCLKSITGAFAASDRGGDPQAPPPPHMHAEGGDYPRVKAGQ